MLIFLRKQKMSQTKAIIFDMDGVIIDSEPLWKKAEIAVFGKYGYQFTFAMCEETKGMRVDEVTEYWKTKLSASFNPTDVKNDIVKNIISLILKEGKPMPGLKELLDHLKTQNYKLAIASSSTMEIIDAVVKSLNISSYFEVIHSAEFEEFGKPHPQVFITTSKKLAIKPSECCVIEDSFYGIIAAVSAKMKVIALPYKEEPKMDKFVVAHSIAYSHQEILEKELYL